jgi:hypothetical protein
VLSYIKAAKANTEASQMQIGDEVGWGEEAVHPFFFKSKALITVVTVYLIIRIRQISPPMF